MRMLTWQDVADDAIMVAGFAVLLAFVVKNYGWDEVRNLAMLFAWALANRLRRKNGKPK